jgi:hypothetical protein
MTRTEEVRIETSTLCSFHCLFCPRDSFKRKPEVMPTGIFNRILVRLKTEVPHLGYLTLAGYGEFGLDPDWAVKLELAHQYYPKIHLITNLSAFTGAGLDKVLASVTDLRISAYAMDEAVYSKVHRPPDGIHYNDIQAKILYLINHKRPGQHVILNYLDIDENKAQTAAWIAYWKDKADLIEVWRPHNWVQGRQYRTLCDHRSQDCSRPFSGPIQILVDGRVQLCCFDYNGESIIGDAIKQSFYDIYDSEALKSIQARHLAKNADAVPLCRFCDQRNCLVCRSTELLFNSRFDKKARLSANAADFAGI